MNKLLLGKLEKVNLRECWRSEAGDFTPWLAQGENIALLGATIGLDLELEAQEKEVGPFRADILCKDTATDNWVLVENQLERTDHCHLGQLLTYAAGLSAVTIVWIAERFSEEHRAALDWLNEITDRRFNFFGLEVELWQIGDSPFAPKFNIISKPNDWSKQVGEARERIQSEGLTETKILQREYWESFRNFIKDKGSIIRPTKPLPQNWMNIALGRAGFQLAAVASAYNTDSQSYDTGEIRAEFCVYHSEAKAYFVALQEQKAEIEREFGDNLIWYNPETAKSCRVYIRKDANLQDRAKWDDQHQWLKSNLEKLNSVFRPRIRNLVLPALQQ
ncbi:MAG: DUF4268 domain-containing protein [Syntrophotaleaceae bacterium]